MRQALHGTGANRIAILRKHDWDAAGQPLQDLYGRGGIRVDDVRGGANKRFRVRAYEGRIIASDLAQVDPKVPSFHPTELGKAVQNLLGQYQDNVLSAARQNP